MSRKSEKGKKAGIGIVNGNFLCHCAFFEFPGKKREIRRKTMKRMRINLEKHGKISHQLDKVLSKMRSRQYTVSFDSAHNFQPTDID